MPQQLTQERLRELFSYDRGTGLFTRLVRVSNCLAGSIAGTVRKSDGRRQIRIERKFYLASRLVWLYVHGVWPIAEIDHEDRDRSNDRLENLREATHGQNASNRMKYRGTSKYKGVSPKRDRWEARIQRKRLGIYDTEEDAARAYDIAAASVMGKFAVLNFC